MGKKKWVTVKRSKGLGDLVMDKQTRYALKKLVTIESYDDGDLYLVDGEIILGSDECKQLFMPVGDLTGQIDKEFETYTRRLLSESKPYSDMTNKELRAESVQAVVLLLVRYKGAKKNENRFSFSVSASK